MSRALSSWLAVRAIDHETRRLDAIERGEPPPPPPTPISIPPPADATQDIGPPVEPLTNVPLPGRDPRRTPKQPPKAIAPRPPAPSPAAAAPAPPRCLRPSSRSHRCRHADRCQAGARRRRKAQAEAAAGADAAGRKSAAAVGGAELVALEQIGFRPWIRGQRGTRRTAPSHPQTRSGLSTWPFREAERMAPLPGACSTDCWTRKTSPSRGSVRRAPER